MGGDIIPLYQDIPQKKTFKFAQGSYRICTLIRNVSPHRWVGVALDHLSSQRSLMFWKNKIRWVGGTLPFMIYNSSIHPSISTSLYRVELLQL